MIKRLFDLTTSLALLAVIWPAVIVALVAVWLNDGASPIYWANRVGKNNRIFQMAKIRSMKVGADLAGGTSTSGDDKRITQVGRVIRKFKLDEFLQLWNVCKSEMHIVGPRPNTPQDVKLYTSLEMKLLTIKPGITDLSSIVFSDEGTILHGADNPDELYNRIIRPWKSRLGILYIENQSFTLDFQIVVLTFTALLSKKHALLGVNRILRRLRASPDLIETCLRLQTPVEASPPGMCTEYCAQVPEKIANARAK